MEDLHEIRLISWWCGEYKSAEFFIWIDTKSTHIMCDDIHDVSIIQTKWLSHRVGSKWCFQNHLCELLYSGNNCPMESFFPLFMFYWPLHDEHKQLTGFQTQTKVSAYRSLGQAVLGRRIAFFLAETSHHYSNAAGLGFQRALPTMAGKCRDSTPC